MVTKGPIQYEVPFEVGLALNEMIPNIDKADNQVKILANTSVGNISVSNGAFKITFRDYDTSDEIAVIKGCCYGAYVMMDLNVNESMYGFQSDSPRKFRFQKKNGQLYECDIMFNNSTTFYVIKGEGVYEKWPANLPFGIYTQPGTLEPTLTDFWRNMLEHKDIVLSHTYPDKSVVKITFNNVGTWQTGDMPDAYGLRSILEITIPTLEIITTDYDSTVFQDAWTISFEQSIRDKGAIFVSMAWWWCTFILNDASGEWRIMDRHFLRGQALVPGARSVHVTTMPTRYRLIVNGKDCGTLPGIFSENGTFTMHVPEEYRKDFNKGMYRLF